MATIAATAPANGQYFATGEAPLLTITLRDGCGRTVNVADLNTANLYLAGPRDGAATRSANLLLNCVTDRAAPDRQHRFINLRAPNYGNPALSGGLTQLPDGTLRYQLQPITNEPAGTYTAGVYVKSGDQRDQRIARVDIQIGNATRETYVTGDPATNMSSCADCHRAQSTGLYYEAHIAPGFAPFGSYAIDNDPIANCKLCHNNDGYSPNPIVRKVHAAHRGEHQLQPGVAHPEYGLGTDNTLAEYTNIAFPSQPGAELDCTKCHTDDRWKTQPSRLACGTCHDNLFFDTGMLSPPRLFGTPSTGPCTADSQCASFGQLVACNTSTGMCERRQHPANVPDANCTVCHTVDPTGISPIPLRHEIRARTRVRGLVITDGEVMGGTGSGGAIMVGDTMVARFKLSDSQGNVVSDVKTNTAFSLNIIVSGPNDDYQRVYYLTGTSKNPLTYDSATGLYTYTFATPFPATAYAPLNSNPANATTTPGRMNPPGIYTLYLYISETVSVPGFASVRDAGSTVVSFRFNTDAPVRAREVVTQAACDSCHVQLQLHGGQRRVATACSTCHTQGAEDRNVNARGIACTSDAQCPGNAAGWEACVGGTCVITTDPTPGQFIDMPVMVHNLHYARLRDGYAERNNIVNPTQLAYVGFSNNLLNFSEILLPIDVRDCKTCHADSGASCTSDMQCGIGQRCESRRCVNRAWTQASTRVCITCHDSAAATGHAALMTWTDPQGGQVETCDVCHGEESEFSVENAHNISNPYRPPYPREPE